LLTSDFWENIDAEYASIDALDITGAGNIGGINNRNLISVYPQE